MARALVSDPASIGLCPRPYDWAHVVELPTGRVKTFLRDGTFDGGEAYTQSPVLGEFEEVA